MSRACVKFDLDWFSEVESAVIRAYEAMKVKGDIDNSVLAGFLLFDSEKKELKVVSLATGTKILSGAQREQTSQIGPVFVHDCHAEVLARRALQCWIWDNMDSCFCGRRLKPNLSLHFYSSSPPCGDCCVHEIGGEVSVQTGAKPFGCEQSDLVRTPPNVVRGKPGRGSRSQSVSCSDKICVWLNCGVEGSLLSRFVDKIGVESVCIGGGNEASCVRAFYGRIGAEPTAKVLVKDSEWAQRNDSPSASSFVWWDGETTHKELIAAKCGRKVGVIEKRQTDPRFFPGVCDAEMMRRFAEKAKLPPTATMEEIKGMVTEYKARKDKVKEKLISYGYPWCAKFEAERKWKRD